MADLSVIIPTHKRAEILRQCLRALEMQTVRTRIEAVVVSDGPDEATAKMLGGDAAKDWTIPVRFFEIPKSQQGSARNRGVQEAAAPTVLFIGDDILLAPDACEKHLWSHTSIREAKAPTAVLGFTEWDPACGVTDVMRWLDATGWQFGYGDLDVFAHTFVPNTLQHRYTYTSHISVSRAVAQQFPFREDLTLYGWEDIIWGKQLADAGIRLLYEPSAKALHHHHMELADSLARMEKIGRSAAIIAKDDPSFDGMPKGIKLLAYRLRALLPTMRGRHCAAFLRGSRRAL